MSPLNLILAHPYYFREADGTEKQLLYAGMRRGQHGILYLFRSDKYNYVSFNQKQVEQLIWK